MNRVHDLAEERGLRDALQFLTREKQWINERHLELCRIAAPTFLEAGRAKWMAAQFEALGCETRIDRAGNVLALPVKNAAGPFVALAAHLDTVLAPKSGDEIATAPGGRFTGPGVCDNGAGLAALLAVARAIAPQPLENLLLVATVGEEGEGNLNGMRHLCGQSAIGKKIAAFVVLDGAGTDHITTQALGSRRFEVAFTGPGGHSWSDYGTANPVHALSRVVADVSDIKLNGAPRATLNIGVIEGGTSVNSIPAEARAKIDIRSESNDKMDELVGLLERAVGRALERENERATGGKAAVRMREIGARPAGRLPAEAAILAHLRAVDAHLGIRARLDCASTDANIPLALGIPAVSIGAGGQGGGAHTAQEWFSPDGRDLGLKRILLTLALLLREPAAGGGA
ncbi:MAG: M20/M25/M40 family metallo-hydrolase [Bryobacteraceae bacterium]